MNITATANGTSDAAMATAALQTSQAPAGPNSATMQSTPPTETPGDDKSTPVASASSRPSEPGKGNLIDVVG